jgi:hypothetical protein
MPTRAVARTRRSIRAPFGESNSMMEIHSGYAALAQQRMGSFPTIPWMREVSPTHMAKARRKDPPANPATRIQRPLQLLLQHAALAPA